MRRDVEVEISNTLKIFRSTLVDGRDEILIRTFGSLEHFRGFEATF
jgi:hypothetical protein